MYSTRPTSFLTEEADTLLYHTGRILSMKREELHRLPFWIQRGELYRESMGNALLTCLPCRLVRYTYTRGADRQQRARCPGS